MKAIHQAQKLYIEYQINKTFLNDSKKSEMKNDIHRFITIAMRETPSSDQFTNVWMLGTLKSALKKTAVENSDVMPVERAYRHMEKYFLLLVQQPWKSEFKEIKMYGGFFRTRIHAVIPDCHYIFEQAGYMVLPEKCTMIYRRPMEKTFLLLLAMDCRVGQMKCRAITEHFNRIKGLHMTLSDVVSSFFQDEYLRDKLLFRNSFDEKYNLIEDNYVVALPVVPKREPIINNSNIRHIVKLENEALGSSDHYKLKLMEMNAGMTFPPRPPHLLRKPSLLSADVIHESLANIDNINDETIPELPQGTCEDHMRETLKLVNSQDIPRPQISEDWKWDGKNISELSHSNLKLVTTPYSFSGSTSGNTLQRNYKPEQWIDEGIEQDMSQSKSFSIGSQQGLPNKHVAHFQSSFDLGYRTGNPDSMYSQNSTSLMHNQYPKIYHPPNISDSYTPVHHKKMVLSRQNALPHQMPSRALKPTQNTEDASLYSQLQMSTLPNTISKSLAVKSQLQTEAIIAQPTLSAPGYLALPQTFQRDHILNSERPPVCKTSSLTIRGNNNPLSSQQIATSRKVHNVNMTFWECPSCSKLNTSLNTICLQCSQSYMGPDVSHSGSSRTQAML